LPQPNPPLQNKTPGGNNVLIIFKCGDDLRQDLLTLQMFRIMDKMWKKQGLNLKLNPYGVIPTGAETGMVEVVTNSNTVSKIQKVRRKGKKRERGWKEIASRLKGRKGKRSFREMKGGRCRGNASRRFEEGRGRRISEEYEREGGGRRREEGGGRGLTLYSRKWRDPH
jgi:hypothetical protein